MVNYQSHFHVRLFNNLMKRNMDSLFLSQCIEQVFIISVLTRHESFLMKLITQFKLVGTKHHLYSLKDPSPLRI